MCKCDIINSNLQKYEVAARPPSKDKFRSFYVQDLKEKKSQSHRYDDGDRSAARCRKGRAGAVHHPAC